MPRKTRKGEKRRRRATRRKKGGGQADPLEFNRNLAQNIKDSGEWELQGLQSAELGRLLTVLIIFAETKLAQHEKFQDEAYSPMAQKYDDINEDILFNEDELEQLEQNIDTPEDEAEVRKVENKIATLKSELEQVELELNKLQRELEDLEDTASRWDEKIEILKLYAAKHNIPLPQVNVPPVGDFKIGPEKDRRTWNANTIKNINLSIMTDEEKQKHDRMVQWFVRTYGAMTENPRSFKRLMRSIQMRNKALFSGLQTIVDFES